MDGAFRNWKANFTAVKAKGITQEQLAFMVGVSAGAVSNWETGISQTKGY